MPHKMLIQENLQPKSVNSFPKINFLLIILKKF
jgi:hypothetical protein